MLKHRVITTKFKLPKVPKMPKILESYRFKKGWSKATHLL